MQKRTIDPRVGSNKLDRSSELNTANVNIIIIIGLAAESLKNGNPQVGSKVLMDWVKTSPLVCKNPSK